MKLCVPTNWQTDLLPSLAPYPVKELYGSLPQTPVGSGRPAMFLPKVSPTVAKTHIRAVLDAGWTFDYVVNAMCVDTENAKTIEPALIEHLRWARDLGVTVVTAAHPLVLEIVKRHLPELRVKMSILCDFDTVGKALALQEMGADEIALSIMCNRDFDFLKTVTRTTTCELTLLLNQACLYMCPHRINHGAANAHASRGDAGDEGFGLNYCLIKCSIEKMSRPSALIKSPWIRPEDIARYESLGIENFKIAGREMGTNWIVNAVRGFSGRAYDGNLCDLLNGIAVMMGAGHKDRCLPYVDNRALDGFLDLFESGRCTGRCSACHYCDKAAERAVNLFPEKNAGYLKTLSMMLETIV